jgi:hypothetical protein
VVSDQSWPRKGATTVGMEREAGEAATLGGEGRERGAAATEPALTLDSRPEVAAPDNEEGRGIGDDTGEEGREGGSTVVEPTLTRTRHGKGGDEREDGEREG